MKFVKILILTALSSLTMQSFAQTPFQSLCNLFASSPVSIACDYETEINGTKITGQTELFVQGDMYTMRGNGLEVYCNGTTLWTVDESSSEVVIEPCSSDDRDYLSNPVLLLTDVDKLFEQKSRQQSGTGIEEYVLEATVQCGVSLAELTLKADGTLVDAQFVLEDGNTISVKVQSMKKAEEKPSSFFSLQRKLSSDWIVTDLR